MLLGRPPLQPDAKPGPTSISMKGSLWGARGGVPAVTWPNSRSWQPSEDQKGAAQSQVTQQLPRSLSTYLNPCAPPPHVGPHAHPRLASTATHHHTLPQLGLPRVGLPSGHFPGSRPQACSPSPPARAELSVPRTSQGLPDAAGSPVLCWGCTRYSQNSGCPCCCQRGERGHVEPGQGVRCAAELWENQGPC